MMVELIYHKYHLFLQVGNPIQLYIHRLPCINAASGKAVIACHIKCDGSWYLGCLLYGNHAYGYSVLCLNYILYAIVWVC